MRQMIAQINPANFKWVEDASIVLIIVVIAVVAFYLFYKRIIVWGSTCELLLASAEKRAELAEENARQSDADVKRLADDFNANLSLVVRELTHRGDGHG